MALILSIVAVGAGGKYTPTGSVFVGIALVVFVFRLAFVVKNRRR
jgi:hypothetical protein